jgi:uncharacterized membrane protein YbhN (UPF0104 family)
VVLSVIYCSIIVSRNWQDLQNYTFEINWGITILSILLLCCYLLMMSFAWQATTKVFNCSLPLKLSIPTWFISCAGRYIPGKIWYLTGRVFFYKMHGQSATLTGTAFILDQLMWLFSSVVVAAITLSFLNTFPAIFIILLITGAVLGGVILFHPSLSSQALGFLVKRKYSEQAAVVHPIRVPQLLRVSIFYLLAFVPFTIAFYLFAGNFASFPVTQAGYLIGSLSIATVIGTFAIFIPGGLGVREGVLIWCLSLFMPSETAIIIAISARIWFVSAEVVCLIPSTLVLLHDRIFCK